MAQLVRAPPCHGGGRGFESHSGRLTDYSVFGIIAQLGEHLPYKQRVIGSSPIGSICRSGGTGRRPGLKIPWVVIPVPVRFRSAALVKNGRNVEFTAFLFFSQQNGSAKSPCSPIFQLIHSYSSTAHFSICFINFSSSEITFTGFL